MTRKSFEKITLKIFVQKKVLSRLPKQKTKDTAYITAARMPGDQLSNLRLEKWRAVKRMRY